VDWRVASDQVRDLTEGQAPFDVKLEGIRKFPVTNVIYIEVGAGARELYRMHDAINSRALAFDEPFVYHPHITLAQEIPPDAVSEVHDLAQRRWKEFQGTRAFRADRAAFVRNTLGNCWIDLAEFRLGAVGVR
jgi:2'-5' RNA ligase